MKIDNEKRATFWIRRWKMVGGGFEVAELEEGYEVHLARRASAVPSTEQIYARSAASLVAELDANPGKRAAVMEIVGRQLEYERQRRASTAPGGDGDPPQAA